MTAALYNEEVTVAPVRMLTVVRDTDTDTVRVTPQVAVPKNRPAGLSFFGAGDPLVDGAARLLSIPLRHVYAALWRVGVLEVQA
jgi:hypothetical protein